MFTKAMLPLTTRMFLKSKILYNTPTPFETLVVLSILNM